MSYKTLAGLILLLLPCFVRAQSDPLVRVEFETTKDIERYHFAQMGAAGCCIFYESSKINADSCAWLFMLYDTNLLKTQNVTVPLPASLSPLANTYADGVLYLLLERKTSKKSAPSHFLLAFNYLNGQSQCFTLGTLEGDAVSKLQCVDNQIVIVSSEDDEDYIYYYDLTRQTLKKIDIADATIFSVEFCEVDTFRQRLLFGLVLNLQNRTILALYLTDYQGVITNSLEFPIADDYLYNSARLAVVDSARALIVGTYNSTQGRNATAYHSGVYTMTLVNDSLSAPQFFNYMQLRTHDSTKTAGRALNLQLLIGDIVSNGEQFAFTTEVFYPEYTYQDFNSFDSPFYGAGAPHFNGFRYVNAYITTFDARGNLLWDNYFPFENLLTNQLARRVSLFFCGNDALIYFPYQYKIISTLVNGYTILEKMSTLQLETNHPKDVVEYCRNLTMQPWCGRSFVMSGYQYIKNNSKTAKSKKYLFFVNKLMYR